MHLKVFLPIRAEFIIIIIICKRKQKIIMCRVILMYRIQNDEHNNIRK